MLETTETYIDFTKSPSTYYVNAVEDGDTLITIEKYVTIKRTREESQLLFEHLKAFLGGDTHENQGAERENKWNDM